MKRIFLIIFLGVFILSPLIPQAAESAGLVPCGRLTDDPDTSIYENCPCSFCHFFVMLDNVFDFLILTLTPIVAVLMLVIGGVMFFFAGANPQTLKTAKDIIFTTLLGLAIIFAAWIIINTLFGFIGVADWTGLREGWWKTTCSVPDLKTDIDGNCIMNCNEKPPKRPGWCDNDRNHNHIQDD